MWQSIITWIWCSSSFNGLCPYYMFSLYFYVNITMHIHQLWILSPLLHDIYYQQYYLHLKSQCEFVLLNNAVSILMLEYTFLFEGIEAAPQGGSNMVGTNLIEFLSIKTRVLLLLLLFLELVCYSQFQIHCNNASNQNCLY